MVKHKRWQMKAMAGVAAAGAVAISASAVGCSGCSNRLPPNPVPEVDGPAGLPEWFPETPWSGSDGNSQVFIEGKIIYDTDKATIRPESEATLQRLLAFLKERPDVTRLRVEGHTDSRASEEYNQDLSARRSLSVCNWLVDNGIDHLRLIAVGFGEARPIGPNDSSAGRQENRRTEFHVAEVRGAPFLGKDPSNGGLSLDVLSKQEREEMARLDKRPVVVEKPFVPEGNIIKPVDPAGQVAAPDEDEPADPQ